MLSNCLGLSTEVLYYDLVQLVYNLRQKMIPIHFYLLRMVEILTAPLCLVIAVLGIYIAGNYSFLVTNLSSS